MVTCTAGSTWPAVPLCGSWVKTSASGAPALIVNELLTAETSPDDEATSEYVPDLVSVVLPNVATPPDAATGPPPDRAAPAGPVETASVTGFVAPGITFPCASKIVIAIVGAIAAP